MHAARDATADRTTEQVPWLPSCPAACKCDSEGYAERKRREQPEGRQGDAASGARADRSERGTSRTQISCIRSADRSERGNAETQIFQKNRSADWSERGTSRTQISLGRSGAAGQDYERRGAEEDAEPQRAHADEQGRGGGDRGRLVRDEVEDRGDGAFGGADAARQEGRRADHAADGERERGLVQQLQGRQRAEAEQDHIQREALAAPRQDPDQHRTGQAWPGEQLAGALIGGLEHGDDARGAWLQPMQKRVYQ